MNRIDMEFRRAEMERAALMPFVGDGERLSPPRYEVRLRPSGYRALFKDGVYVRTTGEKTEEAAQRWLKVFLLQQEAVEDGTFDVRRVSARAVLKERQETVERKGLKSAAVIVSSLKALEVHVGDRQLRQLTDEWLEAVRKEMEVAGYSYEYFCNATRFLCTGIRKYTRARFGAVYLPFEPPRRPGGRSTVVTDAQRDRVKRWRAGSESYDPKTGVWTPVASISPVEARDRELAYRELYIGLTFGSRPGIYEKLAWEPHDEGGWFDLDGAVFHRVPPGTRTASNKLAPPVAMPKDVVAELRRWKAMDAGNPWVFRTVKGGPLGQDRHAVIFADCMKALGIEGVTGHVLRHSCITKLIGRGKSAPSISAVCGISIRVLHSRYGHWEAREVQMLAHDAMASMMGGTLP
jgi:integrase